ncbi:cupin domain-containing protein [Marinibaculum pumilum]|uniref:Cupin domain-containing protein n=1 Tax=Marinibaculum pumilum TaxID=1766165 RepID=A0ABV7KVA5_9PROT
MTEDETGIVGAPQANVAAFEAQLAADGFEILPRDLAAGTVVPDHVHDFEVRALVTGGAIDIIRDGESRTYRAGEIFTVARGEPHAERIGPDGARYIVGRRA